ncbi:S1 family peptidase [Parathalassolituus penaei]|uniref:Serine protease n=1 Tax=Parathalassolituus penaei TaxID=2997323 RepID=A0A9X3EFY1_9GAMM|nr:serine protease [Parathalassolituus penaei]MCY0966794.1 serine protease [Parathalassolituus penaei]
MISKTFDKEARLSSLMPRWQRLIRCYQILLATSLLALLLPVANPAHAETGQQARELFASLRQQVHQIRIIDIGSGNKHVIGSGFQVSTDGLIATNFHVVSDYVHHPEKFRVEYFNDAGQALPVTVMAVDVVHDLAILRGETSEHWFNINTSALDKGERIFSMGNPHDLGMTIIEGTYNGELQQSRYRKILFSGSLNPGMSGGPAFNGQGEIIGVNVSTGGDQISFLVPAQYLQQLLERARNLSEPDISENAIADSLLADQQSFYQNLLNGPFATETLGQLQVPGKLDDTIKCWGNTNDDRGGSDSIDLNVITLSCQTDDDIFLSSDLQTGELSYRYHWLTTKDLNGTQFYSQVQGFYRHASFGGSREDKGAFHCDDSVVRLQDKDWKVSTCFRAYRRYPQLLDASLIMAAINDPHASLVVNLGASGISRENALALFRRFMETLAWKS